MRRSFFLFILFFITINTTAQSEQEILKKQTDGNYYKLLNNKEIPTLSLKMHGLGMLSLTCTQCPHILMNYLYKESEQVKRNAYYNRQYKMVLVNYDKDSFVVMSVNEKGEPILNYITKDKNKLKSMTPDKLHTFAEDTVMKFELE